MNKAIIKKAIHQAAHSDVEVAKVVAVVTTESGYPLFASSNRRLSYTNIGPWTDHAEARAVRRLRRYRPLDGPFTFYVIRFKSDGSMAMSKPCAKCHMQLCINRGLIGGVWFTNEKGLFERLELH